MNDQRIGNLTLPWRRRGAKHFTAPQYHHVHTLLKIFIITSLLVHSIATTDAFAKRQVNVLILRDVVITPIIVEVIEDAIDKSAADDAECLIIQLSTNGGMVDATQQIIEVLLNAEIPVVVYVAPRGARAFSAGTFILIAGHIAVMAPGTTTGAAHPVALPIVPQSEGESERQREAEAIMLDKLTKALVGTAKAVAEERKRKFEWAERVILKSEALTAGEAVKCGLIDFIAEDLHDLVSKLDDRTVKVGKDTVTLRTKNARINYLEMTPKQKFLEKLSHPNMAFILLLVAMFGFLMEIYHPGAIIPAVVGS
ncbi:MAG TPA: hypothetical protein EYP10_14850, partial [Armatimonadetes bacterium]|nr:hypothetical protein [Armatimonadota bacterium]